MKVTFEHSSLDELKRLMDLWVTAYEPFFTSIRVSKEPDGFKGVITYPSSNQEKTDELDAECTQTPQGNEIQDHTA